MQIGGDKSVPGVSPYEFIAASSSRTGALRHRLALYSSRAQPNMIFFMLRCSTINPLRGELLLGNVDIRTDVHLYGLSSNNSSLRETCV